MTRTRLLIESVLLILAAGLWIATPEGPVKTITADIAICALIALTAGAAVMAVLMPVIKAAKQRHANRQRRKPR